MSGQAVQAKVIKNKTDTVVSVAVKRSNLHLKLAIIVGGSLAVLAITIGVVVLVFDHYHSSDVSRQAVIENTNSGVVPAASMQAYDAVTDAEDKADKGDYKGAQAKLDAAITLAGSNKASQGILYEGKAAIAENAQQYSEALQFARQAEVLNPTANSALIIARVSESNGDKQTAAAYYAKTAERTTGYDKQDYSNKAAELSK